MPSQRFCGAIIAPVHSASSTPSIRLTTFTVAPGKMGRSPSLAQPRTYAPASSKTGSSKKSPTPCSRPGNIRALKRHIADAGYTGKDLDAKHIRDVASDAFTYTAPEAIPLTQDTFAKFIDHIEILATQAVIHFSIPLPPGGPQSGSQSQTVTFPAEILI